jgi:hypothetical protein
MQPPADSSCYLTWRWCHYHEYERRIRAMNARVRADHTENEKREMRDTLRIEHNALLNGQGAGLYTEIVPAKRTELVGAMSKMSECKR